jgi:hypothetical protein
MKRSTQTFLLIGLAFLLGATTILMVGSETNASLMQWVNEWDKVPQTNP